MFFRSFQERLATLVVVSRVVFEHDKSTSRKLIETWRPGSQRIPGLHI